MANALLIAEPREPTHVALPAGAHLRPLSLSALRDVSSVYHQTYLGTPHEMTEAEAHDDITRTWAGEYGHLLTAASLGVWVGDELVGAILTVQDPPWDDVPPGPFILDLFVLPAHRRTGLGRALVQTVQGVLRSRIALRVDHSAPEARSLYVALGFHTREAPTVT
ncbi:GNAT family N-acetyltransferase [Serinibacter salmoneus]|uniref:Acetyltransferase (GNAT) family protein n=1 Tax=Serinibacter salmoneus TaxID=556530 RepID=A0A2A9D2Q9_9MICO|nr:GNAT family N-acetyltransferase [Serinibacter salmoneus]PFG20242.1 acetyltransferase (GNAT) family protein [Serinibacter salmoneus]